MDSDIWDLMFMDPGIKVQFIKKHPTRCNKNPTRCNNV